MKKTLLVGILLSALLLFAGCSGVSQAEYNKVVAQRDALLAQLSALTGEEISLDSLLDGDNDLTTNLAIFNEEMVLSQLEVTEYGYADDDDYYAFLAIKNNSEFDLSLSVNVKFYSESGTLVGASNTNINAVGAGTEILLDFKPDEKYASMDYDLYVAEDENLECAVSDFSYESVSAAEKEIVTLTNNGTKPALFVEGKALFFNGTTVVGYDWDYFEDNDSELKPGRSISKELECEKAYDSVKLFFTGARTNNR